MFLVVFLAFALGAVLAWESFGSTLGPTFFYPAAGVTASAMMLSRRALWPAVIAAILVAALPNRSAADEREALRRGLQLAAVWLAMVIASGWIQL